MFLLSNILLAMAKILSGLIFVYTWVIIISALLSWVRPDPYNPIVRFLHAVTEPVLWRIRRRLPFLYINGIDLTPLLVILLLQFIDYALISSLGEFALRLRSHG